MLVETEFLCAWWGSKVYSFISGNHSTQRLATFRQMQVQTNKQTKNTGKFNVQRNNVSGIMESQEKKTIKCDSPCKDILFLIITINNLF